MPVQRYPKGTIAELGRELFDRSISGQVQDRPRMDFLAIDVDSGDFESGPVRYEAVSRLMARHPDAQIYVRRVGVSFTYQLGGGLVRAKSHQSDATSGGE